MDIKVGVGDLVKLGAQLVGHKVVQYRLGTSETVEVRTNYGTVKGLKRITIYDSEPYYAFEGLPYAKPPLGELRFRAPQPPEPWQGVRDCTYYRAKPLQKHFVLHLTEGSEDCLYLNVYAKHLKTEQPLPVIVWLYGGGFQIGEATRDLYSPDYFMKKNVILIAVNYRLGALGFLSLKDPDLDVPGNAGLKDQVQALRWIKQNISNFNGDPNNITLMGESAGSASAHIMLLTDQTKGLFHKAIMQSGTALCSWADSPDHDWAYRLACKTGYSGTKNEKEIFRFLSKIDAGKIVANDNCLLTLEEKRDYLIFSFGPVIEPFETEHCVVPKHYREMLQNAWGNTIPIIMGGNSFEGLFSYQSTLADKYMLRNFETIIPRELRRVRDQATIDQMVTDLKRGYFGDSKKSEMELFECLHILSLKHFWHDIYRTARARLAYAAQAPTFLYRFDFDSPHFNHYRILKCGNKVRGVCHADEISYLFYNIASTKIDQNSQEYKTIERMIGMWTAFAATSNPNCEEISTTIWKPLTAESDNALQCFNISNVPELIDLPETKFLQIWNSFYTKEPLY